MKNILRIEEAAQFFACIYIFHFTSFAWWWFPVLIFTPDISMIGYLINTQVGAFTYNLGHHKALAILLGFTGLYFMIPALQLVGIILFAHSSMDRIMGYGLKFPDNFKNTHLGWIGKQTNI